MLKPAVLLLVLTGAVWAQDFEDQYHEAYALEVIDNKPADAARRYLALLRQKKLPDRLKAQCEFRFAVTCVILGRADEARARLAAIAADPKTPAALKPQIEEYRRSLRDVAPGRELDKRLDKLKYDLAKFAAQYRAEHAQVVGVVREFQIIGKPAIPFLVGLLDHSDSLLRDDAFMVLSSMDAPKLWERWRPEFRRSTKEYLRYLHRDQDRLNAFALKLLELKDPVFLRHAPTFAIATTMPEEFLRRLARLSPKVAVEVHKKLPADDAARKRLDAWMRQQGPIAPMAAELYRRFAAGNKAWVTDETFRVAAAHVPATANSRATYGLKAMARHLSTNTVLAILESATPDQLRGSWAHAVAGGLRHRKLDAARYEKILRRWWGVARKKQELYGNEFSQRLLTLVRAGSGQEWLVSLFAEAPARHVATIADVLQYDDARNARLVRAAWKRKEARPVITELLVDNSEEIVEPAMAREAARFLPDLVAELGGRKVAGAVARLARLAHHLKPDEARTIANRIADAHEHALPLLFACEEERFDGGTFYFGQVVPALRDRIAGLSSESRTAVARSSIVILATFNDLPAAAQDAYRSIALADLHAVEDVTDHLAALQKTIPPYQWVPRVAGVRWAASDYADWLRGESAQPTVDALLARPQSINDSALRFIAERATVPTDALRDLLRRADARLLPLLVGYLDTPTFPKNDILAAVARLASDKTVPDTALAQLAKRAPLSNRLLSAYRRLLASADTDVAYEAVGLAGKLGTRELLPDLARLVDSLDPDVRELAEHVIEKILTLDRRRRALRVQLAALEREDQANAAKAKASEATKSGGSGR